MSCDIVRYSEETFESIKHVNEYGQEYWMGRELRTVLGYTEWRNFIKAIVRAKEACDGGAVMLLMNILLTSTNHHQSIRTIEKEQRKLK